MALWFLWALGKQLMFEGQVTIKAVTKLLQCFEVGCTFHTQYVFVSFKGLKAADVIHPPIYPHNIPVS